MQTVAEPKSEVAVERPSTGAPVDLNEFNYRPIPMIAVVGLVTALLSSTAVFVWLVLPVCLLAFVLSLAGFIAVRRGRGAYGGLGIATAGMFLSLVFFASGIGFQVYAYQNEVPEGYQRISFVNDISEKGMRFEDNQVAPPPDVLALDGKKVFLKGYIYQSGQSADLSSFLFVKDNQSCCFGANPKLWDRIGVIMQEGKTVDYHAGKVAVSGTFRINPNFNPNGENLEPLYLLEGDLFSTRISDF